MWFFGEVRRMAASVYTIEMDFSRAQEQAGKLDAIAARMVELAESDMADCLTDLLANWKGESAALYGRKGREMERQVKGTAEELRKTAQALRTMAASVYRAEKQAVQAAKTRTYGE